MERFSGAIVRASGSVVVSGWFEVITKASGIGSSRGECQAQQPVKPGEAELHLDDGRAGHILVTAGNAGTKVTFKGNGPPPQ